MEFEKEMMNLIMVWLSVLISLCYCYWISSIVPKGTSRLLCLLPIVSFFLFLPLNISSVHLTGITGFFIAWLANFKLLLFAFGKGPLNSSHSSISLGRFLALACLPIKITHHHEEIEISQIRSRSSSKRSKSKRFDQNGRNQLESKHSDQNGRIQDLDLSSSTTPRKSHVSKRSDQNGRNQSEPKRSDQNGRIQDLDLSSSSITPRKSNVSKRFDQDGRIQDLDLSSSSRKSHMAILQYGIKGILLGIMVKVYDYSEYIHPNLLLCLYCLHIYFLLELCLAVVAAVARAVLGLELEPHFNDPILSTSLQDFWGRRWNLMVTSILRPTVYEPTLNGVRSLVGPKWAPLPAVIGTFVVSAVMHELIMYYMGRLEPSFRMTWFFLLHGFCLTVEIGVKKAVNGKWRLPRLVSGALTVGFVLVTCFWLFLPEFLRCRVDVRAFEEYAALGAYVKNVSHAILAALTNFQRHFNFINTGSGHR